jgi:hypothetical protein
VKDDIEMPTAVPKKRRQVETLLDKWIAVWLDGEDITPSERRRLEEERQRRKDERARQGQPVGVLVGYEGATPEQVAALREALAGANAVEIHHPGVAKPVHSACRSFGVPVVVHRDVRDQDEAMREVVRSSRLVIGVVKEMTEPHQKTDGVWGVVKYAKHRRLPVRVLLPSGEELQQQER